MAVLAGCCIGAAKTASLPCMHAAHHMHAALHRPMPPNPCRFLEQCQGYGLLGEAESAVMGGRNGQATQLDAAARRSHKIARFRLEKAAQGKLDAAKLHVSAPVCNGSCSSATCPHLPLLLFTNYNCMCLLALSGIAGCDRNPSNGLTRPSTHRIKGGVRRALTVPYECMHTPRACGSGGCGSWAQMRRQQLMWRRSARPGSRRSSWLQRARPTWQTCCGRCCCLLPRPPPSRSRA